jgi:hypothetical protein
MKITVACFTMICVLFASGLCVFADEAIESRSLHFQKGSSSITLKGSLKGSKTIDYKLRAMAGQTMNVTLKSSHLSNYFNVLPPGSKDVAMFVGSTGGNKWTGPLTVDGDYTIRVYLMRSAARRNETANFTLIVGVTDNVAAEQALGTAPATDAKVKGTPYHATGKVPCSMGDTPQGSAQCDFGVIRGKSGKAEVHLTPPGGFERRLTFTAGKVTTTEGTVKARNNGDLWLIDVNDYEHYQIPDAVISGG